MAGVQSAVFLQQGFGVQGEVYDTGPIRALPYVLQSVSAANNVFGSAFSILSPGVAQCGNPGGAYVFAGFLINPKGSASFGTSGGGPLAPTLTLANFVTVEILEFGSIIVSLPASANPGDLVCYDNTTGALSTVTPGSAQPGGTSFTNAVVARFANTGAGLAVITVSNVPVPPT